MPRFASRTVVVTGAARGIGRVAARRFAQEGASVAFVDMNREQVESESASAAREFGAKTLAVTMNVADIEEVRRGRQAIADAFGRADVFVNCAAITDDKLFLDSTPADWRRMISIDLEGAMNCMHVFLPDMVSAGAGRMVFLASDSARMGQARLSYYAAAKAGVIALVKSVAQEVGRSGVNINVISPGATNTEMRIEREARLLSQMGPEKYERRQKSVLKMYPMGRVGVPDDIASGILFLSSDEAAWITGQVLSVNGGYCMI